MLKKLFKRNHDMIAVNNTIQIDESAHKNKTADRLGLSFMNNVKDYENFSKHLVTFWEPHSMASEQFRELRTRILEASQKDGKKVFLISSAVCGEGKTHVATNLAISIASGLHETVLLIDADMRNPSLSRMFGLESNIKGLSEYLTYGADLGVFITKVAIPKVSIITAGQPPEKPSELIGSEYMADLIKEVKNRYDNRYIIIDSPPLIPVADSIVLSSMVDGIIIVVKGSSTQREIVNNAINKIEKKEKIIGLVLNCCKGSLLSQYSYPYPYPYSNK